ncbi:MAG: hypothetical protein GX857_10685 [Bacteroidales bacterium]|nr:hypothetical protein [Bacteroidales bacterium]
MTHLLQRPQGKVLIRVNAIETCKAIIKQLVEKGIYKESETLLLYSSKEIKGSNNYKNLAYNRVFFDQYKIVFTTALIDEGLSIDQAGFTDVLFVETSYAPRPEPIKQFFARFRNEDANRKNYLYLRQKKLQLPTSFKPETMFDEDSNALLLESDQDEALDVLTTYNNLFSNNSYYYTDATVNPFYMAFAATQVFYQNFNIEQLLDYLKCNYNLAFRVNRKYEVLKLNSKTKEHNDEIKKQVAQYWRDERIQIHQILLYHSQNPHITNTINKQQLCVKENLVLFARENIKYFETLYLREKELKQLGVTAPLDHLLESHKGEVTLLSNDKYRKLVNVLKVERAILKPASKADTKTAKLFVYLGQWCVRKKTFTLSEMYNKLKEIGVVNYKAYCNEKLLIEILDKNFNLDVKRNTKTNMIICSDRGITNT